MVTFAGWSMPLNYGSQLAEHEAVRTACGMFDVSHMTVIDVSGAGATVFLRRILANDVARLDVPGKAAYGAMLNERGGIIDDLITYRMAFGYRLDKYNVDEFGRSPEILNTPLINAFVNTLYQWRPYDVHSGSLRLIYRW